MKYIFYYFIIIFFSIVSCQAKKADKKELTEVSVQIEEPQTDSVFQIKKKYFDSISDQFLSNEILKHAVVGLYVFDSDLNEPILEVNGNANLVPASCMKAITSATALELYGDEYQFETILQYSGKIKNGVLHGNIYIKGGGDPAFGSRAFKGRYYSPDFMHSFVNEIKRLGIDSITGNIIADAQIFDTRIPPDSWTWLDIASYYGQAATGLSVYENQFEIKFSSETKGEYELKEADFKPYIPDMVFENHFTNNKEIDGYLDILGSYYSNYRLIQGNNVKEKELYIRGTIPDPPFLVAYQLHKKLVNNNIKIGGVPTSVRRLEQKNAYKPEKRNKIYSVYSPEISAIIKRMNLTSNNLYAEHLLNLCGLKEFEQGSTKAGAKVIENYWYKNLGLEGIHISDGSGLSRSNAVSAKHFVEILEYMQDTSAYFEAFYNSLAISGTSGTLSKLGYGKAISGKIFAKSGSMSRILSYAGYINTDSGKQLPFAFIVNNFEGTYSQMRSLYEFLFTEIVANY
jgi:D-alanyl-D-alanine carboxypeptidase/D-alanyl-D-alanine-endopeptidase (penicillin-binding protein 4)